MILNYTLVGCPWFIGTFDVYEFLRRDQYENFQKAKTIYSELKRKTVRFPHFIYQQLLSRLQHFTFYHICYVSIDFACYFIIITACEASVSVGFHRRELCETFPFPTLFIFAFLLCQNIEKSCFSIFLRGTQPEYSSKPLKHSILKPILVFKR